MSRIGKNPISIPDGIDFEINKNSVKIKNSKDFMEVNIIPELKVEQKDGKIVVERESESRFVRAMHGTTRQLIASAATGLSTGFTKELELHGVGYSANMQGERIVSSAWIFA